MLTTAFLIHPKLQCALSIKKKYRQIAIHGQQTPEPEVKPQLVINSAMQAAISPYYERNQHGPTYVCTVCHRTLFPHQAKHWNKPKYVRNSPVLVTCLTKNYVHGCDSEWSPACTIPQERLQE